MAYTTAIVDRVFFVRWSRVETRDVLQVQHEVEQARKRIGEPLVYVGIVPAASELPSDAVRKAMMDTMASMLEQCEVIHLVIEGSGFRQTIIRSFTAGILLVAGRRGRIVIDETLEEAVHAAAARLRTDAAKLLRYAQARGVVTAV